MNKSDIYIRAQILGEASPLLILSDLCTPAIITAVPLGSYSHSPRFSVTLPLRAVTMENDVYDPWTSADNDVVVPLIESSTLAVSIYWMNKFPGKKVLELMEKSFDQNEMIKVMVTVSETLHLPHPTRYRNTDRRPAVEAQAHALYQLLDDLDATDKLPKVVIPLEELANTQRALSNSGTVTGDEATINARLVSLEKNVNTVLENVAKMQSMTTPPIVISSPHDTQISFAEVLTSSPPTSSQDKTSSTLGTDRQPPTQGRRERSTSRKRLSSERDTDEDGFKEVGKRRKKRTGNVGTSSANLDLLHPNGLGGSVEYFISNTSADLSPDIIAAALVLCGEDVNNSRRTKGDTPLPPLSAENLTIEDMTPDRFNYPRSRCWKVLAAPKFYRYFLEKAFFPPPWRYRNFFPPRAPRGGEGERSVEHETESSSVEPPPKQQRTSSGTTFQSQGRSSHDSSPNGGKIQSLISQYGS